MKTCYYIEKDGQVFLLEKDGLLVFPENKKDIPFPFKIVRKMPLKQADIYYCTPQIKEFPSSWVQKDSIPLKNVDSLVQLAINRSLVRPVADAIIVKDKKVLMVKSSRGFVTGIWDLPGGFVDYGETPEEAVIREVKEETGLDIHPQSLLLVNSHISESFGFSFLAFIYVCKPASKKIKTDPEEIAAIEWMQVDEAIQKADDYIKNFLREYKKSLGK